MTLSTKIEVLRILHLFPVGLHTCTAVARSLFVSWAFLFNVDNLAIRIATVSSSLSSIGIGGNLGDRGDRPPK